MTTLNDLLTEPGKLRPLGELAPRFTVSTKTFKRWIANGLQNRSGETVRLPAVLMAGRWKTTPEAVAEFIASISEVGSPTTPARSM